MNKKVLLTLLVLALVVLLSACGGGGEQAATEGGGSTSVGDAAHGKESVPANRNWLCQCTGLCDLPFSRA